MCNRGDSLFIIKRVGRMSNPTWYHARNNGPTNNGGVNCVNWLNATPIPVVSLAAETSGNATREPNRPSWDAVPRTTATAVHSPGESMRSPVRGGPIDDGRTNSFCNRSRSLSRYSPESNSRGRWTERSRNNPRSRLGFSPNEEKCQTIKCNRISS